MEYLEETSAAITINFFDLSGNAVVPDTDTIKWTLTNNPNASIAATVINNRLDVAVTSAATINITLNDADLALLSGESGIAFRVITITYQFDDATYGNNLKGCIEYQFTVKERVI